MPRLLPAEVAVVFRIALRRSRVRGRGLLPLVLVLRVGGAAVLLAVLGRLAPAVGPGGAVEGLQAALLAAAGRDARADRKQGEDAGDDGDEDDPAHPFGPRRVVADEVVELVVEAAGEGRSVQRSVARAAESCGRPAEVPRFE